MNDADFETLLSRHGVKTTANRLLILRALAEAGRPMSMTELETRIRTIDKSNIFRTLCTFRENSLVHVLEDGSESARYELCLSHDAEHDEDVHVHFYCERCHRTFCLEGTAIPPVCYPEGYEMRTVNYMAKGLCPHCAGKPVSRNRK